MDNWVNKALLASMQAMQEAKEVVFMDQIKLECSFIMALRFS